MADGLAVPLVPDLAPAPGSSSSSLEAAAAPAQAEAVDVPAPADPPAAEAKPVVLPPPGVKLTKKPPTSYSLYFSNRRPTVVEDLRRTGPGVDPSDVRVRGRRASRAPRHRRRFRAPAASCPPPLYRPPPLSRPPPLRHDPPSPPASSARPSS